MFAVAAILPSGRSGPTLSAAAELRRLGSVAANGAAVDPGDGFLYTSLEQVRLEDNEDLASGLTWTLRLREQLETWVAADGTGRQVRTIEDVEFPSDADRANWVEAGRPELPAVGSDGMRFGPGTASSSTSVRCRPIPMRSATRSTQDA